MVEIFVPSRSQPFVDSDTDSVGICVDLRYLRYFRAMESVPIREIRVPFAMAAMSSRLRVQPNGDRRYGARNLKFIIQNS